MRARQQRRPPEDVASSKPDFLLSQRQPATPENGIARVRLKILCSPRRWSLPGGIAFDPGMNRSVLHRESCRVGLNPEILEENQERFRRKAKTYAEAIETLRKSKELKQGELLG